MRLDDARAQFFIHDRQNIRVCYKLSCTKEEVNMIEEIIQC